MTNTRIRIEYMRHHVYLAAVVKDGRTVFVGS